VAVDREEAQAGGVQPEEVVPSVAEQFAGLFCGRVRRNRVVDLVGFAKWHLLPVAVDRGRRGEDEVPHPVETAALEQVGGALDVDLLVERRPGDGGPHPRPGGQVHHPLRPESGENRREQPGVEDVAAHQFEICVLLRAFQVARFERRVIEVVEVVQPEHLVPAGQQAVGEIRTDEAGGTGHENAHGGRNSPGSK
jgi:hypothetical protein